MEKVPQKKLSAIYLADGLQHFRVFRVLNSFQKDKIYFSAVLRLKRWVKNSRC